MGGRVEKKKVKAIGKPKRKLKRKSAQVAPEDDGGSPPVQHTLPENLDLDVEKERPRSANGDAESGSPASAAAKGGCLGCLGLIRDGQPMTVKQITSDFVDRVGGDGFHDIKRSSTCIGKLVWITLFLLAWAMVCYQVYVYITKYISYPINTKVELKFDDAAVYPAVSFCNLNPVRSSKSAAFGADVEAALSQSRGPPPTAAGGGPAPPNASLNYINVLDWDAVLLSHANATSYDVDEYGDETWSPDAIPSDVSSTNQFYTEYFEFSDQEKRDMGHHIEDMLVECVWKERQCYPSNFTHFLHPLYGNCYSFNAGFESGTKATTATETTSMPGPRDGLSLTLYVEEKEYIPLLADSVGVRVHVHGQGQNPQPEDTGYTVSAGFSTALEVRKVFITRLPLPYNSENCSSNTYPHQDQVQAYWPPANYSMATCNKLCYQDLLSSKCGCVDPEILYLGPRSSVRPCDSTETADAICAARVDTSYKKGDLGRECQTKCPQACEETDFEVYISSATWPNQYYMEILQETGKERLSGLATIVSDPQTADEEIRTNTLKFSVYYQSLNYRAIKEEAAYVLVDMLADLGGAVDLWVGMSVLALCQCIEWIVLCLAYVCCRNNTHSARSRRINTATTPVERLSSPTPTRDDIYGPKVIYTE